MSNDIRPSLADLRKRAEAALACLIAERDCGDLDEAQKLYNDAGERLYAAIHQVRP